MYELLSPYSGGLQMETCTFEVCVNFGTLHMSISVPYSGEWKYFGKVQKLS